MQPQKGDGPAGSPPRMRGKAPRVLADRASDGITPAYAGKRRGRGRERERRQDHPRVCGEKRSLSSSSRAKMGSPPRVRGKDPRTSPSALSSGITPAYAGKRKKALLYGDWNRDHPRICGEKFWSVSFSMCVSGSPPHMRGKGWPSYCWPPRRRITPAYAGKSRADPVGLRADWDHPRICGEKPLIFLQAVSMAGSPPHMRGKGGSSGMMTLLTRITPAYAGKRPRQRRL